jgi:hypothetical protein
VFVRCSRRSDTAARAVASLTVRQRSDRDGSSARFAAALFRCAAPALRLWMVSQHKRQCIARGRHQQIRPDRSIKNLTEATAAQ